jgi:histidyl-tRNA synthetase
VSRTRSFQAPIGTRDVLPPESARWERLLALFAGHAERAGFGLIQGPLFEDVEVFRRESEGADAVRKEMYDFEDKGGRRIALRPEGTAPVVRAFVEHRPQLPWKVWYAAPNFRYEKPQAGRYRQHHQVGIEALGTNDPDLDVEILTLGHDYLASLGLVRFELVVNSMGERGDLARYVETLRTWLEKVRGDLAPDDRAKVDDHPMRVLDSKRRETIAVTADAPRITDGLSDAAVAHFERVQAGLRAMDIPFRVEPRLVRGFDYYTHTTFEFRSPSIESAQSTLLGGGRYDGLVEELGGPPTPGIGFGSGIERVLLACDAEEVFGPPERRLDVFVVDVVDGTHARDLTAILRRAGLRADRAYDGRAMRAQMKAADRSGAALALIVGEQELADGVVAVRDLQAEMAGKEQVRVTRDELVTHVRQRLTTE